MNEQEEKIDELMKTICEKNIIISALVENSKSQTITSKVLLDRLIKQEKELNIIKSTINLN